MAANPPAKQAKKERKTSKSSVYQVNENDVKRTRRSCPKCGPGVFLAQHENRESCGNCGFSEWKKKA